MNPIETQAREELAKFEDVYGSLAPAYYLSNMQEFIIGSRLREQIEEFNLMDQPVPGSNYTHKEFFDNLDQAFVSQGYCLKSIANINRCLSEQKKKTNNPEVISDPVFMNRLVEAKAGLMSLAIEPYIQLRKAGYSHADLGGTPEVNKIINN